MGSSGDEPPTPGLLLVLIPKPGASLWADLSPEVPCDGELLEEGPLGGLEAGGGVGLDW